MTPPPPEELLEHPMATAAKAAASGATAFVLRFMIFWEGGGLFLILLLGPAGGSRHCNIKMMSGDEQSCRVTERVLYALQHFVALDTRIAILGVCPWSATNGEVIFLYHR